MTEEEMEGPISFWGYKEQESNLILPEHDDDDIRSILSDPLIGTARRVIHERIEKSVRRYSIG
jgi:hypothetical protein